jgi:hypothetical protein
VTGLLRRNAGGFAETAQLGAEQQAQDKPVGQLAVHAGFWLPGARHASTHYRSDAS